MDQEKVLFCWSGGKDSALALYEIQRAGQLSVTALLTTMADDFDRVSMHGVRRELMERQAAALELPLDLVYVPRSPTNAAYEARMEATLKDHQARGVAQVGFGDIFLEDLKAYRDRNLARLAMSGVYPLWKRDTRALMEEFIRLGFRAVVACVDTRVLPESFVGRLIDSAFLRDLPPAVDPCGENGEFHSFVFDGPNFRRPVDFSLGERRLADGFCYQDLIPQPTERDP
jgi:uncharacterized protein (TIGR00290 family)